MTSITRRSALQLLALGGAGALAFGALLPLSIGIVALLVILVFSYRQTIKAYPQAGGAYLVTRDNFGILPAQVAGVALLTDYILTVSVSVSAGTAALTSVFEGLFPWRVLISVAFVLILTAGNLRGVRESGKIFRVPTFFFIGMMGVLLIASFAKMLTGHLPTDASQFPAPPAQSLCRAAAAPLLPRVSIRSVQAHGVTQERRAEPVRPSRPCLHRPAQPRRPG